MAAPARVMGRWSGSGMTACWNESGAKDGSSMIGSWSVSIALVQLVCASALV